MIVYYLLLIAVAAVAYFFGSLSTKVIASNFVFHSNLLKYETDNRFISNFRRLYGIKGFVLLALVEIIKDVPPIVIGGLILSIKGHADVGRAFAGFCMVLGRMWPSFYSYRGSHASFTLIAAAAAVNSSLGIAAAVFFFAVTWLTKYVAVGTVTAAVVTAVFALLVIDVRIILVLVLLTCLAVIVHHIPSMARISNRKEEKLSLKEDLSYKFDEKFDAYDG